MCVEFDRTPVEADTYLSLCLHPLNASSFVGVGKGVGVTSIPRKAITLAPPFCWVNVISYSFSH